MKKVATATLLRPLFSPSPPSNSLSLIYHRHLSTSTTNKTDDKEWNDAWETAWLPDDDTTTTTSAADADAPWDSDATNLDAVDDSDAKAFIDDMNQNWHHRRSNHPNKINANNNVIDAQIDSNSNNEEVLKEDDYRLKKQRIHAGLWTQQIHRLHESKLGANDDDIDNLLHSCSELFDSGGNDPKVPSYSEIKNKPDGWETTSKPEDGNVWEMSQREEDVLLQEFERRSAFCKFQIASFIKTHIFSRRRPIDGWKYMIEVIGPNAKKGKGSVSRIPGLADPATQPFTEERTPISGGRLTSRRAR